MNTGVWTAAICAVVVGLPARRGGAPPSSSATAPRCPGLMGRFPDADGLELSPR